MLYYSIGWLLCYFSCYHVTRNPVTPRLYYNWGAHTHITPARSYSSEVLSQPTVFLGY